MSAPEVRFCPLGRPAHSPPVRYAFCSECKRVRKSNKGCPLVESGSLSTPTWVPWVYQRTGAPYQFACFVMLARTNDRYRACARDHHRSTRAALECAERAVRRRIRIDKEAVGG